MKRTQNTIYIVYNKYRNTSIPNGERVRYLYISMLMKEGIADGHYRSGEV